MGIHGEFRVARSHFSTLAYPRSNITLSYDTDARFLYAIILSIAALLPLQLFETPQVSELRVCPKSRTAHPLLTALVENPRIVPQLRRLVLAGRFPVSQGPLPPNTPVEVGLTRLIEARRSTLEYVGVVEDCRVSREWAAMYPGIVEILGRDCREVERLGKPELGLDGSLEE